MNRLFFFYLLAMLLFVYPTTVLFTAGTSVMIRHGFNGDSLFVVGNVVGGTLIVWFALVTSVAVVLTEERRDKK